MNMIDFKNCGLPSVKIGAYSVPKIHYLFAIQELRPTFHPIDRKKMAETITMNQPM